VALLTTRQIQSSYPVRELPAGGLDAPVRIFFREILGAGQDETRDSKFGAATFWDAARSRANLEFQACHRDRPREPDPGQSFPRSVSSSLWDKRIVQHNPNCKPVQHSNQQLARQAFADRCDATAASSFRNHLRPGPRTRSL